MTKIERIYHGDALDVLKTMEDNTVDSVVSDPPYGLSKEPDINEVLTKWLAGEEYDHKHGGFMGKSWDSFVPHPDIWREVYRVLKPGGHALVFAGTRTQDLMTISLRLAGFEVRDVIQHIFFSGFPKSHNTHNVFKRRYRCELENISANLVETSSSQNGEVKETDGLDTVPEVVLAKVNDEGLTNRVNSATRNFTLREHIKTAKDEEIKVLFVVTSVSQNGKNSLQAKIIRIGKADDSKGMTDISLFTSEEESIDSNTLLSLKKRLGDESDPTRTSITLTELKTIIDLKILSFLQKVNTLDAIATQNHTALKPAHEPIIVVRKPLIDADTGRKLTVADCVEKYGTGAINIDASRIATNDSLDRPQGETSYMADNTTSTGYTRNPRSYVMGDYVGSEKGRFPANCITLDSDQFYSKYFNVSPAELSKKASKKDRNSDWKGEEIDIESAQEMRFASESGSGKMLPNKSAGYESRKAKGNYHPTVKPTDLMAWLVRLITPPNGTVLDPFAGSGSTLVAAKREGFGFIGVELTEEYIPIIEARTGVEHIKAETSEGQAKE